MHPINHAHRAAVHDNRRKVLIRIDQRPDMIGVHPVDRGESAGTNAGTATITTGACGSAAVAFTLLEHGLAGEASKT